MLDAFGRRQQALLRLLLTHKGGLAIDALARSLTITKTAVYQHIVSLERDGYVEKHTLIKTGGRPSQLYTLSDRGTHLFPKQYSLFARLMVQDLIDREGTEGLAAHMGQLGRRLAASFAARLAGRSTGERLAILAEILQEAGYEVELEPAAADGSVSFTANNCVLHGLAMAHPEICEMDRSLLQALLDGPIEQSECIAQKGMKCRFHVPRPPPSTPDKAGEKTETSPCNTNGPMR